VDRNTLFANSQELSGVGRGIALEAYVGALSGTDGSDPESVNNMTGRHEHSLTNVERRSDAYYAIS
jgi:hypothetical protein